ncbi:hypothetical protein VDG1235_1061 [Verrucomicrobiia bacterium DG1235]|nr:hypothetical protein VDG1235_1061 [Verrucomicrobiae bacterium DG1235]
MIKQLLRFVLFVGILGALALPSTHAVSLTFTDGSSPQEFLVPTGVTSVKVLAIGGGGGGANGHQGGGGSGYVSFGTFSVSPGQLISIVVGLGGNGGIAQLNSNAIVGLTAGTASSFGSFLTANGGGVVSGINQPGGNGGSGGGGSNNGGTPPSGAGGSGGSNGGAARYAGGLGQGDYTAGFGLFTENTLSAGAGGLGGTTGIFWQGGGGAGGILIGGSGPVAESGYLTVGGKGGVGYGAGGGGGGYDSALGSTRWAGGDGADGLVYIEFDGPASVPDSGSAVFLLVTGLLGIVAIRRKVR